MYNISRKILSELILPSVLLLFTAMAPAAGTGGNAVIYPGAKGRLITDWGYDIKWEAKGTLLTPTYANTVFVDQKFSLLRLPVWGNISKPAHPADGVVVASKYASTLAAMTNVKNANPNTILFASKKLDGQNSFPDWVKESSSGPVIPAQYARMLADFLQFMESQGFYIDVLGVDNEWEYNEGDITPQRYKDIVDELKALSVARGFHLPVLIAPEMYGLQNANSWMNTLLANNWGDRVDMAGTHYYPQWRNLSRLQTFVGYAGDRPKWHTEVHWDGNSATLISKTELSLRIVFDCTDEGFSGFTWWGYPFSSLTGEITQKLTTSTAKSRPVYMDDIDGTKLNLGTLMTRAFISGNQVRIWVINNSSAEYTSYGFDLNNSSIASQVDYTRWTETASSSGAATTVDADTFELDIPAYTVSLIEFTIATNSLLAHYTFDNNTNDSSGSNYNAFITGEASYSPGIINQAILLDGIDDYLSVPYFKGILGTADRTCAAWIKTSAAAGPERPVVAWGAGTIGNRWCFRLKEDATFGASVYGGNISTVRTYNDGQWHHVAATLSSDGSPRLADIKLYVDGSLETNPTITNDPAINTASAGDVIIGSRQEGPPYSYFNGLIDDLRIYDYALNSYNIAGLYFAGVPEGSVCLQEENYLIYDYDKNCVVELADLVQFASAWLSSAYLDQFGGFSAEWLDDSSLTLGDMNVNADLVSPAPGSSGDIESLAVLSDFIALYSTSNQWAELTDIGGVFLENRSDVFSNQIGAYTLCINPLSGSAYFNTGLDIQDYLGARLDLCVLLGQRWSDAAIGTYEIGTIQPDGTYTALQTANFTTTQMYILQPAPSVSYYVSPEDSGRIAVRLSQQAAGSARAHFDGVQLTACLRCTQ